MYKDGKILERVCDLTCTIYGMGNFNRKADELEYGDRTFFDKYYSLDTILKALNKYKNKEIDAKYLSYWANSYNLIINGLYKESDNSGFDSFKKILKNTISFVLDGLSFFDEEDHDDIGWYEKVFVAYDELYHNTENYQIYFIPDKEGRDIDDDYIIVYAVNKSKKKYYIIDFIFLYDFTKTDIEKITKEQTDNLMKELKSKNYEKIDLTKDL